MTQVDFVWYQEYAGARDGDYFVIVKCGQPDCDIRARRYASDLTLELLPLYEHLIRMDR